MEEYWKDLSDTVEASNLVRVRSKFLVIKGEELGDGLELVMPKYFNNLVPKTIKLAVHQSRSDLGKLSEGFLRLYAKAFLNMKDKQFAHVIDPRKIISVDNIEVTNNYKTKPVGENPSSYLGLQRDIKEYRKEMIIELMTL